MISYYKAKRASLKGARRLGLYDVNCLRLYLESSLYFSMTPIKHTVCQVKEDDVLVLCQTDKNIKSTYYEPDLQHCRVRVDSKNGISKHNSVFKEEMHL